MRVKIESSVFTHCLRVQIYPGWYEDERIESIRHFCTEYGIKNVMFFINAEDYNLGHITKDEAKPWIETIKKAKHILNGSGVSVSLNHWNTLLHADRGRQLKDSQKWITMKDKNGLTSSACVCMLDPDWQKYYLELAEYFIKEIQPEVFWVEDDFRFHNHSPLYYGGCFCERHMREYNIELGTNYSAEEFTGKVFSDGALNPERKAWLDVQRKNMRDLAEVLGDYIKSLGTETVIGLMSSIPAYHALEARDWHGMLEGFGRAGKMIDRIHLPAYEEYCAKQYYYHFNNFSMLSRAYLPADTIIYPELENIAFSTISKDSRFLKFQVESAIPLLISGMTYDIFDFVGNGAPGYFGYGEKLRSLTPYLQGVMDLGLKFDSAEGIVIPIDELSVYNKECCGNDYFDLMPKETDCAGYLSLAGINYVFKKEKKFKNRIIALFGNNIRNFSLSEAKALINDNFVYLDGGAVLEFCKLGLGELIGVKNAFIIKAETNVHSFEQACENNQYPGISGMRASAQSRAGDYVKIDYISEVNALTDVRGNDCRLIGSGITATKNVMINPYVMQSFCFEQFHELRLWTVMKRLFETPSESKLVLSRYQGISPYLYENQERYVIMLTNSTVGSVAKIKLTLKNIEFKSVQTLNADGKIFTVKYTLNNGVLELDCSIDYLSTRTIILNKLF